jgi:aspartate ammonia-lyase
MKADVARCRQYAERSVGLATALNPHIGYDKAAELVKEAVRRNVSIRQVMQEHSLLKDPKIARLINDPFALTKPG